MVDDQGFAVTDDPETGGALAYGGDISAHDPDDFIETLDAYRRGIRRKGALLRAGDPPAWGHLCSESSCFPSGL